MQKPSKDLKTRIGNGYTWLKDHLDDPHYPEALALYDSLVDEAELLGISEKDCWPATDTEIDEIFVPTQPALPHS